MLILHIFCLDSYSILKSTFKNPIKISNITKELLQIINKDLSLPITTNKDIERIDYKYKKLVDNY